MTVERWAHLCEMSHISKVWMQDARCKRQSKRELRATHIRNAEFFANTTEACGIEGCTDHQTKGVVVLGCLVRMSARGQGEGALSPSSLYTRIAAF